MGLAILASALCAVRMNCEARVRALAALRPFDCYAGERALSRTPMVTNSVPLTKPHFALTGFPVKP